MSNMDKFTKGLERANNFTYTENGAVALKSTNSGLLDAFGSLGAMRKSDEATITNTFIGALSEDKLLATKLMFWLRNARGGAGERRSFRVILKHMANVYPAIVKKNIENIPYYGRYDDLLILLDTPLKQDVVMFIRDTLQADIKDVKAGKYPSLLAKWLPSENASSASTIRYAKTLMKSLQMTPANYRKMLTVLRKEINLVETHMSKKEWDKIDFSKIPSRAALIYAKAFMKNDPIRYKQYLRDVAEGKAKINASVLFPVDIIKNVMAKSYGYSEMDMFLYDAMWRNLPNYFDGLDREESGLCVVDVSGSMSGEPMEVAISLGLYCADKAKGAFKNKFITFSANPELQTVKGDNIFEKVNNLKRAHWDMNTNIEAVFDVILNTAITNKCSQDEIPSKLYIISDMQFDQATSTGSYGYYGNRRNTKDIFDKETFIETMRAKYEAHGYSMPNLVYWNVRDSKCGKFQETADGNGFCMVSGYSPSLFKAVILGTELVETVNEKGEKVVREKLDPISMMLNTLNDEMYDRVVV